MTTADPDYQVDRTRSTSSPLSLTPTSYIVLGLIEMQGEGTPYDLKTWVTQSVGNFWSVPHSAIYAETVRLTGAGLLIERREQHAKPHLELTFSALNDPRVHSRFSKPGVASRILPWALIPVFPCH
jgi:hypothetical protein